MADAPVRTDKPKLLAGISRNTLFLGLVSFFNDLSSDMIHPHLLLVFLDSVLGVPAVAIGMVGGLSESAASLLKPVSGWLSDRLHKRKPAILFGYWIAVVSRPLLAVSTSFWHVAGLRFADRVGKGARTAPRDAMIADSTPARYRGKAFGLHRALDTGGAAVGILVSAAVLYAMKANLEVCLRTIFLIASIPGLVLMGLIVWGIKEDGAPSPAAAPRPLLGHIKAAMTPDLARWYVVVFVFWLGNSSNMFLILKARGLDMPVWQVPLLVFVMSVVHTVLSTPAGALSDRIGRRAVIVAGWVLYALVYLGFAVADAKWMMFALFGVYGAFYSLTEGAERALVSDMAPEEGRATALGLYHFVVGAAALPASVVCGWLWTRYGPPYALGLGAACALAACLLFFILRPGGGPKPAAAEQA